MPVKVRVQVDDQVHEEIECEVIALNAVLFEFNPSANACVTTIKALSAALITYMHQVVHADDSNGQQRRNAAIAITEMEAVQMRAVKALFAK